MKITLSKSQWEFIGNRTGWIKKANAKKSGWFKKSQDGIKETSERVVCDSGIEGWKDKLQNIYDSMEEFVSYDQIYNLCKRLGYEDPEKCWEDNPTIQGSINPSDLKRIANKQAQLIKNTYFYHINLDERGEFYADVRRNDEETVFEIKGFDIFKDGFMKNSRDMDGLKQYLTSLGTINEQDELKYVG